MLQWQIEVLDVSPKLLRAALNFPFVWSNPPNTLKKHVFIPLVTAVFHNNALIHPQHANVLTPNETELRTSC